MLIFIILQFILILFLLFLEIKQIKINIYIKKNALCCYEFVKSMGPNISAVSIVAIFIPMENVPMWYNYHKDG